MSAINVQLHTVPDEKQFCSVQTFVTKSNFTPRITMKQIIDFQKRLPDSADQNFKQDYY